MNDKIEMPDDWDDHASWENFYAALPSNEFSYDHTITDTGSFSLERLGSLIDDFRNDECMTLWFPGCGFSPLPRIFSSFGFHVIATDIASSAINYQINNSTLVQPLLGNIAVESVQESDGVLKAELHDFRTPFGDENVDAIFNIKAIQGLPCSSLHSACRSHFAALRPGGVAFFDTMNVQDERRDQLENALAEAGFYVPLYALDKWYRKALSDTGIPHMFVLGTPMIPQTDDISYPFERGTPEYNRDIEMLRDLTAEYRSRMESEFEKEQQCLDDTTKHAQLIYCTG